ncbi:hypothetical protein GYMLUDRAFT_95182 [Collybiopsis luxurians FD-317 M1]|uniref:Uncharacterized protein n=1 Tax=Collybiopsis luxurians FD-317 M1 TaxID=944289 RepID=A0A0D0CL00_9AGAR|nr:hypothetical protein GYMLUDRAFT_95182 [Collybiopsis luxurians FD-317 M1]
MSDYYSIADDSKSTVSSSSSSYYSSRSSSSYTTSVSSLPTDATDTLTTESSLMLQWRDDIITPPELRSNPFNLHHRQSSRELRQMERGRHRSPLRSRPHSCKRARSHETYREREFTRDFFLIIIFCFVLACCLICMGRPFALLAVLDKLF